MNDASEVLLGLHDFKAFCRKSDNGTSIRTLEEFSWTRTPDDLIRVDIKADAFCYTMVRALVGATLLIGEGKRTKQWLADYLANGVKDFSVFVAPALALTLVEVKYPAQDQYAERIKLTLQTRPVDGEYLDED
jgi:tRNA pseudouridine38-40 synthase